jgi:hypothetical protein
LGRRPHRGDAANLATTFQPVTMTLPDGSTHTITLNQTSPRLGLSVIDVDKPDLYRGAASHRRSAPCGSDWIGLRRNEGYTWPGSTSCRCCRAA